MKKNIAVILCTMLLATLFVSVLAAPSPSTSATLGDVVVETEKEEIEIPADKVDEYVNIVHVHEAEEGENLYEIGQKLTNDSKIGEVIGEEYEGSKLIQLFGFEYTENFNSIEGVIRFTFKIDSPTFLPDMNIILVKNVNGEWVQHEHTRLQNGYITMTVDYDELDAVWGVLVEKAPVSPPTGDTFSALPFAIIITVSLVALGFATKKYLAHK